MSTIPEPPSCAVESHIFSSDPRKRSCLRPGCHESKEAGQLSDGYVPELNGRSEVYESQFLGEAAKFATKRFGLPTDGFQSFVEHRLKVGEERYKGQFASKGSRERATEIIEEAADAAAYAVLDAQARINSGLGDDASAYHTFEIAQHAAAIDAHARALK